MYPIHDYLEPDVKYAQVREQNGPREKVGRKVGVAGEREAHRNSQHHIPMAFQHLHDLTRLQVPDVHFMVLAPTYHPLRSASALFKKLTIVFGGGSRTGISDKRSRYTIRAVRVAGVGFDAAGLLDAPEAEGRVLC